MASQSSPVGPQQLATGNNPVLPDRQTADRWTQATHYFERSYRNAPAGKGAAQNGLTWGTIARVTTTVTAASGGTYGAGVVTFQTDTGTALADDSSMAGVTVKNMTSKTIASGSNSRVCLAWALGSWWVVAVYDCSMLS